MGAFASGFLKSFTSGIQQKIDQNHEENEAKKKELRNGLWKIAYDPNQPEAVRQNAQEQLQKLYGPEGKKGVQKFSGIFDRITNRGRQQSQQPGQQQGAQPQQPAQPSQPLTPPPMQGQGTGAQPMPAQTGAQPNPRALQAPQFSLPPAPTDAQLSAITPTQRNSMAVAQMERDRRRKRGEEIGLNGRDLAEFEESGKLPSNGVAVGNRKQEQWELEDGTKIDVDYDPKSGVRYDQHGSSWDPPEGSKRVAAPKGSGQLRQLKYAVTLDDAKTRAKDGAKFRDVEGKDIDIDKLPTNNVLEAMETGDGRIVYTPVSPTENTFTVGNRVYARTPFNSALTGTNNPNAPVDLGAARTGSQNTPTNIIRDNQGVPHVVGSTSTPNTPGATPRGAAPQQGAPQQPQQAPPPAAPQQPSPAQAPPAAPAPAASGRQVAGVTPGMDKDFMQTARTIQQGMTQVVGDDSNPGLKTLVSTGPKVLSDPKKVERVGKAISMMLGAGEGGLDQAHVQTGVSAAGISFGLGGFGEYLQQVLNVPAKTANKINENLKDAMKDLTPDERDLVASSVSAFEESIAMRSINKSGVSNSQVAAIQRTLPLIGVNTFNVGDFADRVQNWTQQGLNGQWGVPPNYFRPDFLNRLKSVSGQMEDLKKQGKPSPKNNLKPPSGASSPKNADQYLQSIGVQ